jgi:hypothetical protein
MNLKTYKKLHKKYSKFPLAKEVWDTPEHQAYTDAFHNDKLIHKNQILPLVWEKAIANSA